MPQFFFHTADGGEHRDAEGIECKDMGAARREAIRYAGAVLTTSRTCCGTAATSAWR